MAQKQLSELTDAELKKNIKIVSIAVAVIVASIILMAIAAIFSFSKKGFSMNTILPVIFTPIVMMNVITLKKLKAELESRKK